MGVWVQRKEAGGYQRAGTKKPCQGLFLSQGIGNRGPQFKPRLSHFEQAGEAGLGVHIWAEGGGESPTPGKGSGRAGTLPPHLPLSGRASRLLPDRDTPTGQGHTTQARPHIQAPLLKYIYTQNIF